MNARLYRVILPVHDMDSAAGFYEALLDTAGERVSPGRHYLDLGGTILAIYDPVADGDPKDDWQHHPNQYIYIAVDDVDAAFERAQALGAMLESEQVESMPWGERLFYARDPSGNPICLVDDTTLFLGGQP
ncbi:MAG: VOC family protein [Woeseiaceae bacterium]|nr:VOC family protein [Woeseiaceae bacterium]